MSRGHPNQVSNPPQLVSLDVKEWLDATSLVWISRPISEEDCSQPACGGKSWSRSFSHCPQFVTVGESRNIDGLVIGRSCLFVQRSLHQTHQCRVCITADWDFTAKCLQSSGFCSTVHWQSGLQPRSSVSKITNKFNWSLQLITQKSKTLSRGKIYGQMRWTET